MDHTTGRKIALITGTNKGIGKEEVRLTSGVLSGRKSLFRMPSAI